MRFAEPMHFASHMLLYMLLVAFCYSVLISIATGIILFVATAAAVEELSVWKTLARFELWVADSTVDLWRTPARSNPKPYTLHPRP